MPSPFQVSAISTSPSCGQVKGSKGRSQKAGQMPDAQGNVRVATRLPRGRASRWRDTSRAEVYFRAGSGVVGADIARRTRRLLGVLFFYQIHVWMLTFRLNTEKKRAKSVIPQISIFMPSQARRSCN